MHGESEDEWQVVEVTGSRTAETAFLADGATVRLAQDGLVLTLREARVQLRGEVSQQGDQASIRVSEGRFAGREIRWEQVDEGRARLLWPGKNGTTVMGLERGTR